MATINVWELQQEKDIQEVMEKARQLFLDRGLPEDAVSIRIQEKKVGIARDILSESRDDYDVVVVGRWGISKLKDLVWGGVANKLIGHLDHSPLCVVGGNPEPGKILVALDTSAEAMRTVEFVKSVRRQLFFPSGDN